MKKKNIVYKVKTNIGSIDTAKVEFDVYKFQ